MSASEEVPVKRLIVIIALLLAVSRVPAQKYVHVWKDGNDLLAVFEDTLGFEGPELMAVLWPAGDTARLTINWNLTELRPLRAFSLDSVETDSAGYKRIWWSGSSCFLPDSALPGSVYRALYFLPADTLWADSLTVDSVTVADTLLAK